MSSWLVRVVARAARVPGATVDDFDALCAHLATIHPSLNLFDLAVVAVFRAVWLRDPVGCSVIAGVTSLSIATVNHQAIAAA